MSRIYVALLFGLGITALICLAVNIPFAGFFLAGLLAPGGMFAVIFPVLVKWDSVPLLLAANVLFYSTVAYGLILLRFLHVPVARLKSVSIQLVLPVMVLCCLACIPRLNPLLPVGMAELSKKELDLQSALPINSNIRDARAVLSSRGIVFVESVELSEQVVFQRGSEKITTSAGDRVLAANLETPASKFPCGYRLDILLVFGADDIMKARHIGRFPLCP
jgi:hypothetical protein